MRALLSLLLLTVIPILANAEITVEAVEYKQGDTTLKGYLYYDNASNARRPGVLVVHEWWGLNDYAQQRARLLAEKGYVALALDMYGEGRTTSHPEEAGQWAGAVDEELGKERFMAAYELLRNSPLTEEGEIVAIGYCFGGGVVLRAAKAGIDLRGVVSFHGSLPASPVEAGTIKARILVCHGASDPFVESGQVEQFQRMLTDAGADWQFISYGGAKHSFTSKEADTRGIPALAYNEAADRRSWAAMFAMFDEIFGE